MKVWIIKTADGFYAITPTDICNPEDHGKLNPQVVSIEDIHGNVLWSREGGAA